MEKGHFICQEPAYIIEKRSKSIIFLYL